MARVNSIEKIIDSELDNLGVGELRVYLKKAKKDLRKKELLLSVTQKIAGKDSLSEILWELIEITTRELKAERGSLFLNDPITGELYSRVAQGELTREIRLLNSSGIAGSVFQAGVGEIVHKPYDDERFNSQVDEQTGFTEIVIKEVPYISNLLLAIGLRSVKIY